MRKTKYSVKQLELAWLMLNKFSANKISRSLNLPRALCRRIKKESCSSAIEKKRLTTYGPESRLLAVSCDTIPLMDVFLFTSYYPSDIIRCLGEYMDLN